MQTELPDTNKVTCPICDSQFLEFAPFGVIPRENAKCTACGSLERQRLIWLYLNNKEELLEENKKIKLLHFAPEKAFNIIFTKDEDIIYTPCDLYPELYNVKGGTAVIKADIINLPFKSDTFDAVICSHVLEHIPDDIKAMREIYRIMKIGAWCIMQIPIDKNREKTYEDFSITSPKEREKAFGQWDHVRWYGNDFRKRLEDNGFCVIEDDFVKTLSKDEINKYGLDNTELIYLCLKK